MTVSYIMLFAVYMKFAKIEDRKGRVNFDGEPANRRAFLRHLVVDARRIS